MVFHRSTVQLYFPFNLLHVLLLCLTASKEEENQTRNQDSRKPARWPQHHHTSRHRQGSSGQFHQPTNNKCHHAARYISYDILATTLAENPAESGMNLLLNGSLY
jgi:hypothetical protein